MITDVDNKTKQNIIRLMCIQKYQINGLEAGIARE